ncbi:MAG: HAMP domain-containing sensor histidine kinase, partial [bacterium]
AVVYAVSLYVYLPPLAEGIFNALLVIVLVFPLFFVFIVRPLIGQIIKIRASEERLSVLQEQLKQYSTNLEQMVAQRTSELVRAKLEAEFSDRAKTDFIANMSHELRSPLNSIIGFSEVLQDEYYGKVTDQQRKYLQNINESGKHLLSMISDILDISQEKFSELKLASAPCRVKDILEASVSMMREKAVKHSIKLSLAVLEQADIEIEADAKELRRVFFNIIDNAIKFTSSGGKVQVSARKNEDGEIEVMIEDTGIGIKKEDLTKIFGGFTQLEAPYTKKYAGAGIGLTIAKKIVDLHGGRVWVLSEGENKGSRVFVTIPIKGKGGEQ